MDRKTPGYFFSRHTQWSNIYNQLDYIKKSDEIVNLSVNQIQIAVQNKDNLVVYFSEMLTNLAKHRHDIAKKHHTDDASAFGKFRESVFVTSLFEKYSEYNAKLVLKIKKHLYQMTESHGLQQGPIKIDEPPTSLGKKTSIDVALLSRDIGEWANNEEYEKIGLALLVSNIERNLPIPPSSFPGEDILVTIRYEDNGIEYPLTRYLTRIKLPVEENDLVEVTLNPISTLIHQEPAFIENSLAEIASLFKTAIELDKENLQELIEISGHLNYLFSHAMPFDRGSAAIGEWIETIIFRYHGYDVAYNNEVNINLEALISPLHAFIEKYPSMIKISPIPSPEDLDICACFRKKK